MSRELSGAARRDDVLMTLTRKPEGSHVIRRPKGRCPSAHHRKVGAGCAIDRRREGFPASVSDDRDGTAKAGAGPAAAQNANRWWVRAPATRGGGEARPVATAIATDLNEHDELSGAAGNPARLEVRSPCDREPLRGFEPRPPIYRTGALPIELERRERTAARQPYCVRRRSDLRSSTGRAPRLQRGGWRFDPARVHLLRRVGRAAKASACRAEGAKPPRRFESVPLHYRTAVLDHPQPEEAPMT